ncbi:MAG: PspA/IM30 family protein [Acidimicrobiales bacterium]|jgi:phage shock protein A|nr:PspA/IM30 family protein [Acidimicrobiales bacterium]
MANALTRWWKYLGAKADSSLDERADPKVQLEQAIREAQDQHRRLREQAANVIANQKQAEMRLNRTMGEYEKLTANARQALIMADQATKSGDEAKAVEYTQAAEAFANRLIAVERDVEDTKTLVLQSSQAAEQAKAAVAQNSAALQQKLAERQKLLGQLDQAKMQEQMNSAMATLSATVGEDVPTFEQVREKIELRYAKAKGAQELTSQGVEGRMIEVEKAAMNTEAVARLDVLREQMGLPVASASHDAAELLAEAKKLEAPGASSSPETPAS